MSNRIAHILLLLVFLSANALLAQQIPEGVGQGYDGEWKHVSSQLIALAEATPAEKYTWRPADGVRSISEVYMHIAIGNFFFLRSATGKQFPDDLKQGIDTSVTKKAEVISWLKRSLEGIKTAHAAATPKDLQAKVKFLGRDVTVDDVYLRAIVHCNEHMGQQVAYARMNGIVPPWSQ